MIIALEIESTEKCPFISHSYKNSCDMSHGECLGFDSKACPCNRIRCETCGLKNDCRQAVKEDGIDHWKEYKFKPVKFCSNWQPIKGSK